jgi:hypothetical protein
VIRLEYIGEADNLDELLEYMIGRGVHVLGFTRSEANLEDIFLKVTRGVVA